MSPLRLRSAPTPRAVLHRLGRLPNPLDWPPADRIGANRFDDPARHFRVLYAARQRTACFAETLAAFRPSLELLAETGDPADITRHGRWLDVRRLPTLEALRSAFGPRLHEFGLADVDLGGVCGPERAFTQAVAAWAYESGYHGIVYASRFGASFECWAIFDSASIESVGSVVPISLDDTDLQAVARVFAPQLPSVLR